MSIYAIADLHLSFEQDKPMDIFGENWSNHEKKIRESWMSKVKPEDTVIIAGDFSWATYLKDTKSDFEYLHNLPGKKLLLKGNHDYWWTTLKSMRKFLADNNFDDIDFIYNNSYLVEDKIIIGTRGWVFQETDEAEKMINRENERLKLSLEDGIQKYGKDKEILAFIHYPPIITRDAENEKYMQLYNTLKKYNVEKCYYGHLHGIAHKDAIEGMVGDIDFSLISADYLNFVLKKIG